MLTYSTMDKARQTYSLISLQGAQQQTRLARKSLDQCVQNDEGVEAGRVCGFIRALFEILLGDFPNLLRRQLQPNRDAEHLRLQAPAGEFQDEGSSFLTRQMRMRPRRGWKTRRSGETWSSFRIKVVPSGMASRRSVCAARCQRKPKAAKPAIRFRAGRGALVIKTVGSCSLCPSSILR